MRIQFFAIGFLMAASAQAGGWSSGGGNGVVCFADATIVEKLRAGEPLEKHLTEIESIETYDLMIATQRHGFDMRKPAIAPIHRGETFLQYADRIIERTEKTIPSIGQALGFAKINFPKDHINIVDSGVIKMDDVNPTIELRPNCILATMAVQSKINDQYFLDVDDRLFSHPKHSELSKAVLWMHELLYQVARDAGQTDSRNTRILVGKLISNELDTKLQDVIHLERDLGFLKSSNDNDRESLAFKSAPLVSLEWSIYWVRQGGYGYFQYQYDQSLGNRPKEWDLMKRGYDLFHAVNSDCHASTAGEMLAYLRRDKSVVNAGGKKTAEVEALIRDLDSYIKARAEATRQHMEEYFEKSMEPTFLAFSYLTPAQRGQIRAAAHAVFATMHHLMLATYTKEEQAELRKDYPGHIRFAHQVGVFTFEDLNPYFSPNPESEKQRQAADRWERENIWWEIGNAKYCPEDIAFPVLYGDD